MARIRLQDLNEDVMNELKKYNNSSENIVLNKQQSGELNKKIQDFIDTKGQKNGIAGLDEEGKVKKEQLPNLNYISDILTTSGDILYKDSTGYKRLPKGEDGQGLILKNGLPIWVNVGTKIVQGNYSGTTTYGGTENKTQKIVTGFQPKLIIITEEGYCCYNPCIYLFNGIGVYVKGEDPNNTNTGTLDLLVSKEDGFEVSTTGSTNNHFGPNKAGSSYYYVAIG